MFPTPWYAPTFFSRTYWPRPQEEVTQPTRDPFLTDFVTVGRSTVVAVGAPETDVIAPDRFVIVPQR